MRPKDIAELILEGHLEGKRRVDDLDGVRMDLQLKYSGLMARGAYRSWKWKKHRDRRKVGCFDFKVMLISDGEEPMLHPKVIADCAETLDRDIVEAIFLGEDPVAISSGPVELRVATEVQLAMLEQEINWGDEDFQSWSHFLPSSGLRPRDFIMAYLRRAIEEPDYLTRIPRMRAASGTPGVLPPPIERREWSRYFESRGARVGVWLQGGILDRYRAAASDMPDNPHWAFAYGHRLSAAP